MKQIFTLFVTASLCLFSKTLQAQFQQDFENTSSYTNNCWDFEGFIQTTDTKQVISGKASLYTNPPTNNNGSGTRNMHTPFLNIASTTFTVSFNYKLSANLSGQAVRNIEVGLEDRNGTFTSLDVISMNSKTANTTKKNIYLKTFTLAAPSVKRLVLKFSGSQGDGNTRMIVDDLLVNANAYYGPASACNSAPVAADNTYNASFNTAPYTAISVLNNDSDPNGEALTATLATPSADGTVIMNPDGTFTFTPNSTFTASFTTFTYTVTDNGYNRLSTTATVYIYFPQVSTLPIHLLDFKGTTSAKTTLNWSVAANETGKLFEVQRTNGNAWQTIAVVFTSEKIGTEQYQYADAASKKAKHYRLKLVNKDGTFFYSNVLSFETAAANKALVLLQNPVQNQLRFTVPAETTRIDGIHIYNTAGLVVSSRKMNLKDNNNTISLTLQTNLPAGTYILDVVTDAGHKTTTFIKQ